jgi:hypothetical protein
MLERKVKKIYFQILALAILSTQEVYGNLKNFSVNNENLKIDTPKSWQVAKNFLNSAYTFFGPFKNGRRPVISLNETALKDYKFKKSQLRSTQDDYKKGRLKWLKKNKGGLLSFIPYKVHKWPKVGDAHSIGYFYTLLGEQFEEKTYFFKCNGKVFNFTTLMTLDQKKKHGKTVEKVLKSTSCK